LEAIELPQRLTDRSQALRDQGQLQQAEEYRQLWDILCTAMEQCAQLMGEGKMTMGEFAGVFRLLLSQYDVGSIPVALDRLSVGELQRMTHKETKVLFLLGVDDEHFPMVSPQPGLLTDQDRNLLSLLGCEVTNTADELLERERATACDGVCMPSRRLYLSWAEQNGGERRAASLITAAQRVLPGLEAEEPEQSLRYSAPQTALEAAAGEGR
jgi:ATP-dependent helicase/nuclease subunit B